MKQKILNGLKKVQLILAGLVIFSPMTFRLVQPMLAQADSNLVGYWKFDEGTGTTAHDSSNTGNNGTLTNDAAYTTDHATTSYTNTHGVQLDGVNDYVTVPDNESLSFETSMTALAWIKWSGSNAEQDDNVVIDKSNSDTPNYRLILKDNGHLALWNGTNAAQSSGTVTAGQWTLVNFTIDNGTVKFYINGALSGTAAVGLGPINDSELFIGRDQLGRYFNGKIDDARIYNTALTPEEVADIASGNAGPVNNPATSITSDPGSFSHNTTATFEFDSDVQPSTFKCKVDDGAYTLCTSPYTTSTLTAGSHTFSVKAINADDIEDASPATHTWTIQTGTDPFNISTCAQLSEIQNDLNENYVLTQDLNCRGTDSDTAFTDDFETGMDGWTSSGDNDTWDVVNTTCALEDNENSPQDLDSNMLGTDGTAGNDCLLDNEESSQVMSPEITVPNSADATLSFTSTAEDEAGPCYAGPDGEYDTKTVYVTTDGGDTTTALNDCTKLNSETDSMDSREWKFSLADFAGQDIQLIFKYDTADDCCEYELGWYIDNVKVYNTTQTQLDPIGNEEERFNGSFDGQNHYIDGLNINTDLGESGLFGFIGSDGLVKNLTLSGSYISNTGGATGAIAGSNDGTIRNVNSSENTVVGNDDYGAGGIAGINYGTILQSEADVNVYCNGNCGGIAGINVDEAVISSTQTWGAVASNGDAGGIVGDNDGIINTSKNNAIIVGDLNISSEIGGIAGANNETGVVSNNYSTGLVQGYGDIGGIVGYNEGQVERNYSSGNVTGSANVGGVVGTNIAGVYYNFSVSQVIGDENAGAVVGNIDSEDSLLGANYYDIYRTGLDVCVGDGSFPDGEGCDGLNELNDNADYFKNKVSPALANWDFVDVWGLSQSLNDGFPCLIWEDGCADTNLTSADLSSAVDSSAIHLSESGCNLLDSSSTNKESGLSVQDTAYDYPVGFVNFSLSHCGTGGTANINLTFTGDYDLNKIVIRKFNTTSHTFTTLTSANSGLSLTKTTLSGKTAVLVTYHIVDGGSFDQDGSANGSIVDPIGLASSIVAVPDTGFGGAY